MADVRKHGKAYRFFVEYHGRCRAAYAATVFSACAVGNF
jgi:hypothetical protein